MPQNFDRVMNPFMPNGIADSTNATVPMYAPGELGYAFVDNNTGNLYLRELLDSGATSATTVGAVAANQLAFWKDRVNNIVTNDPNFNDTGTAANCVNRVAGVFRTAVTATAPTGQTTGNYCDLLIQGKNIPMKAAQGSVCVPGAAVIADSTTGGVKCVATVTTAPTEQVLGYCRSSTVSAAGTMNVDVSIGYLA